MSVSKNIWVTPLKPEMRDMAMNLAATLAAEEIAAALQCSATEALKELLSSDVGEALYDDELKYWWESPADVADAFLEARNNSHGG